MTPKATLTGPCPRVILHKNGREKLPVRTATAKGDTRMKAEPTIVILSGKSGCGKTTLCAQVAALARARGLAVAGVLTPPRLADGRKVGLDVADLRTGQRRPLAEAVGATDGPATEGWHFHAAGLAWGTAVLRHATPCDLLVMDELGPLELIRDQGWTVGLDLLRAGHHRLALVVVRPELLPRLQERLDGMELLIITMTEANREALLGQIAALLGGYR